MLLAALLSLFTVGTACATQMKAPRVPSPSPAANAAPSPWPNMLSMGSQPPSGMLAYDDHYRHDGHWHSRQEQIRRDRWRREQARREAERRREWERHHHHRR
ncbi:hypothetical protein PMM47T1_13278 [Pseudomonas sp. M47T1]|nr:hypothetical protein PMM47T1_13278 [Pseudomonas sp. M47T1]